jgi:hypothetical protein
MSGPPALNHVKSVALLRLENGTVWMLVLRGEAWTPKRLRAAADVLADLSAQAFTTSSVAQRLRESLGIRSLTVAVPALDHIDERAWEIDKVAFAWSRRCATREPGAVPERRSADEIEWETGTALREELRDTLCGFVAAMDSAALRIARLGRRFDLRVYNYLAYTPCRQYRLQFAETVPSLLLTAVVAVPESLGEEVRTIVDTGAPLVKGLAARWGVRSGVIRHLVGRGSSNVGIQWSRDAKGLAIALNALHPQDLPGERAAEWQAFNRMVITGERIFLQPVWKTDAGLKWLRTCVRLWKRGEDDVLALWLPKWNDLGQVERFRRALAEGVQRESATPRRNRAGDAPRAAGRAVDQTLLDLADDALVDAAKQFSDELGRTRRANQLRQIKAKQQLLALAPGDFISADGSIRVTSLCTAYQFFQHGKKIRNCLRTTSVASMARRKRPGTVFVIGLFDVGSGKPLSTAEIHAHPLNNHTQYRLCVRQHTGKANVQPSEPCARVLKEFLSYCRTKEVRQHLLDNWQALRRGGVVEAKPLVNLPVAPSSTLGEQAYDGPLTGARRSGTSRRAR